MRKHFATLALLAAVALAGCSSEIIRATGIAPLDAYENRNLSVMQKVQLAKRAALIDAQRNLLEEYAGTFLSSQTEVKNFVAENDYIITSSKGLIRGVHRGSDGLTPDQRAVVVEVWARKSEFEAELKKLW